MNSQLKELEKKLDRLEERYINEEIERDLFIRYKEKYITEKCEIEMYLAKTDNRMSNLKNLVDNVLYYAIKLTSLWDLGGYQEKQKLQSLVVMMEYSTTTKIISVELQESTAYSSLHR